MIDRLIVRSRWSLFLKVTPKIWKISGFYVRDRPLNLNRRKQLNKIKTRRTHTSALPLICSLTRLPGRELTQTSCSSCLDPKHFGCFLYYYFFCAIVKVAVRLFVRDVFNLKDGTLFWRLIFLYIELANVLDRQKLHTCRNLSLFSHFAVSCTNRGYLSIF